MAVMFGHLPGIMRYYREELRHYGQVVDVGEWQSLRGRGTPQEKTIELLNVSLQYEVPDRRVGLEEQGKYFVNLPWAEDHFQERVSGEPLNPGEQYKNWPWYRGNVEDHRRVGKGPEGQTFVAEPRFSHTYMERYWPKWAKADWRPPDPPYPGIRYDYGDLNDVVDLLVRSPFTRQAYLPVWFPEDTGVVHGERVPCSLGYHFILRGKELHVVYHIRSCDFFRHFADDIYLTCRLLQWVLDKAQWRQFDVDEDVLLWDQVKVGTMTMHITSLHCFEAERERLV